MFEKEMTVKERIGYSSQVVVEKCCWVSLLLVVYEYVKLVVLGYMLVEVT